MNENTESIFEELQQEQQEKRMYQIVKHIKHGRLALFGLSLLHFIPAGILLYAFSYFDSLVYAHFIPGFAFLILYISSGKWPAIGMTAGLILLIAISGAMVDLRSFNPDAPTLMSNPATLILTGTLKLISLPLLAIGIYNARLYSKAG